MQVKLKNVRLSFHDLFERGNFNGETTGYSATFLLPKDHPQIDEIKKAERLVYREKFGEKKVTLRPDSGVLKDGDEKEYAGFEGHYFIKANSDTKPGVFDRDRSELCKEDGRIYSGCYVNANIDVWTQDNKYGKAIRTGLKGVQFAGDGEPFAGAPAAKADDFDDLVEEAGALADGDDFLD